MLTPLPTCSTMVSPPPPSRTSVEDVLYGTQLWYGPVLLVVFILSAAWHSIAAAKKHKAEQDPVPPSTTGPGGRPLPLSRKKSTDTPEDIIEEEQQSLSPTLCRIFNYSCAGLVLTFLASALNLTVHLSANASVKGAANATSGSHDPWFSAEETVVSRPCCILYTLHPVSVANEARCTSYAVYFCISTFSSCSSKATQVLTLPTISSGVSHCSGKSSSW